VVQPGMFALEPTRVQAMSAKRVSSPSHVPPGIASSAGHRHARAGAREVPVRLRIDRISIIPAARPTFGSVLGRIDISVSYKQQQYS
jgi:hypothetical protein